MSQEVKEQSEKRYQIFDGKQKYHECQRVDVANKKVLELKGKNRPLIVVKDLKEDRTTTYSKSRSEKNYRVR